MDEQQVGRIAFRVEGDWRVAYWAAPNTMEDAVMLGTVSMAAVEGSEAVKRAFMEAMKVLVSETIESVLGSPPSRWGETVAPEHERSGRA